MGRGIVKYEREHVVEGVLILVLILVLVLVLAARWS